MRIAGVTCTDCGSADHASVIAGSDPVIECGITLTRGTPKTGRCERCVVPAILAGTSDAP